MDTRRIDVRRRREYFRIHRFARTYDRVSGKLVLDVRYKSARLLASSQSLSLMAKGFSVTSTYIILRH